MNDPIKVPGTSPFVSVTPHAYPVVVTVAGKVIAHTTRALALSEAHFPPVLYIPRSDVDMAQLIRSTHVSHNPRIGNCVYYSIPLGGTRSLNAAWSFEAPYAPATAIRGHLAFYPHRVDAIMEWPVEYALPLPGHDLALGPVQHAG